MAVLTVRLYVYATRFCTRFIAIFDPRMLFPVSKKVKNPAWFGMKKNIVDIVATLSLQQNQTTIDMFCTQDGMIRIPV
jgi:hypothetical protein